jgi:hypothetical protein
MHNQHRSDSISPQSTESLEELHRPRNNQPTMAQAHWSTGPTGLQEWKVGENHVSRSPWGLVTGPLGSSLTITDHPRVHLCVIRNLTSPIFFPSSPSSSFHAPFRPRLWASSWVPLDLHCLRPRCRIDQSAPFNFQSPHRVFVYHRLDSTRWLLFFPSLLASWNLGIYFHIRDWKKKVTISATLCSLGCFPSLLPVVCHI